MIPFLTSILVWLVLGTVFTALYHRRQIFLQIQHEKKHVSIEHIDARDFFKNWMINVWLGGFIAVLVVGFFSLLIA